MAAEDKFENKTDKLGGKAKEATGKVTGDKEMQAEGSAQSSKADIKDKLSDAADTVKGAFKGSKDDK